MLQGLNAGLGAGSAPALPRDKVESKTLQTQQQSVAGGGTCHGAPVGRGNMHTHTAADLSHPALSWSDGSTESMPELFQVLLALEPRQRRPT